LILLQVPVDAPAGNFDLGFRQSTSVSATVFVAAEISRVSVAAATLEASSLQISENSSGGLQVCACNGLKYVILTNSIPAVTRSDDQSCIFTCSHEKRA